MSGGLSVIGKIGAVTGLITLAGQLLNKNGMLWNIYNGIKDSSVSDQGHRLMEMIQRADHTGSSLAQYTSQMRIVTRVFIDSSIEDEPIIPNLCRAERGWYVAQVLAALQLNQLVSKGVSVQDVLGVVQTGDNAHYQNAGISALKRFAGLASFMENYELLSGGALSQESNPIDDFDRYMKMADMGKLPKDATDDPVGFMNDRLADAASIVDGVKTVPTDKLQELWGKAANALKTSTNQTAGKMAAAAVGVAGTMLLKAGVQHLIEKAKDRWDPDTVKKAEDELKAARTKEELLGLADKYNLDRRLVEKQAAELDAPLNIDPSRVDLEKLNGIAIGELFTVTMTNPDHPEASIPVPVFIQMTPISVPYRVAPRFIDGLVSPSVWQRWTMMTAGEIEFFRDFIGQRDRLREKIRHDDPEGLRALKTFLQSIHNKDKYSLSDVASNREVGNMSQNLANSVLIFSEDTVRQAYAESGVDLHNDADRARYFKSTYAMIISIVDPAFAEVTTYINGIDGRIKFKYSALKPNDKKFDPVDLIAAMAALGDGKAPTLR